MGLVVVEFDARLDLVWITEGAEVLQPGTELPQLLSVDERAKYHLLGMDDIDEFMEQLDEILNELGGIDNRGEGRP